MAGSAYEFLAGAAPDDKPPSLDIEREAALHELLRVAAADRVLKSAQDVSGGGLAVAIAECAIWSGLGADLQLQVPLAPAVALFGESPSRAVVTIGEGHWNSLARLASSRRVAIRRLGIVGGNRLRIRLVGVGATGAAEERGAGVADELDVSLDELRRAWTQALPRVLGKAALAMCGVVGVHAPGQDAAGLAALALFALQHRGQESAGIGVSDGRGVMVYKDLGLVDQVLDERRLQSLNGDLAIAHCRYSTTGSTIWENSQPTLRMGAQRTVAVGHNGNLVNTAQLLEQLPGGKSRLVGTTDTDLLTALLAVEPAQDTVSALCQLLPRVSGAYSLVVMDESHVIGVRDPYGFRPLVLGMLPTAGWPAPGSSRPRPRRSTFSARNSCVTCNPARWSCSREGKRHVPSVSRKDASSCASSS